MGARPRSGPVVDSPSNPTVRFLRYLHSREGRAEQGAFLIEGKRLVSEAVAASWPIPAALYDAERADHDPDLASLVARIPGAIPATTRAVKQAADTVTPQGIVAAAATVLREGPVGAEELLVLVMDGVGDPGNAGALLRSALAAGVQTVITSSGCVDLFSPKVVRAGMGAHFHLRVLADLAWDRVAEALGSGRAAVVADASATLPYYRFDWKRPAALIVGGEARGPSAAALRLASTRVAIPLQGGVESLNVAVAGSVIVFEAKRQRQGNREQGTENR